MSNNVSVSNWSQAQTEPDTGSLPSAELFALCMPHLSWSILFHLYNAHVVKSNSALRAESEKFWHRKQQEKR